MPDRTRSPFARLALAAAAATLVSAPARPAEGPELKVERIMARDWIGTSPEDPYWADDGRAVYYSRKRPGSDVSELHRVELGSGRDLVLAPGELAAADYDGVWSPDRRTKAWVRDGDVWARGAGNRAPRQLTRTSAAETSPLPLSDGRVAFRRGDEFLAVDLATGRTDTLADIRFGKDPAEAVPPKGFVEEQHRRLIGFLDDRARREAELREHESALRAGDASRPPRPIYFAEDRVLAGAVLAPSGRNLLVAIAKKPETPPFDDEDSGGGKTETMPLFVTDSGYVETKAVRPKVGTGKPETPAFWLLDLVSGTRRELDLSPLPGLLDDPLAELRALAKQGDTQPAGTGAAKPAARALRFDAARWSEDGGALALQLVSHDNKDRWIATVRPAASGAAGAPAAPLAPLPVTPLYRESDPAWLGWRFGDFGWMRDGQALWYLSEESGFSHLYVQPLAGARLALTQGPFEVDKPQISRDGRSFFLSANREQAGTYEAYRVNARGGALERLTESGGMTYAIPSPDEKQLLLTSSWTTRPPELYLQPARAGSTAKRLTHTTSPEFDAVAWVAPEIVQIPSAHFAGNLQARLYDARPPGAAAGSSPAVLFVHGAGYLQDAHAGWSDYSHEFMFHTLLANRGYVVLDVDYRASSGYGRDHRTAIYRQMGWPEVDDLADGVAWLAAHRGVDPARVGVYGGSYGGFLTFMSMFRRPELFAAGAALRPVTDWAHYNHGYTSAILNTPDVDPEAYRKSSPIEYAEGLARPLLICHGMVDDNVTFQDSVLLVERLIELGKTDLFQTAIYPVEAHGFKEAASWTDEYKRILKLFEENLK